MPFAAGTACLTAIRAFPMLDINAAATDDAAFPPEVVEEGTQIMEELLRSWAQATSSPTTGTAQLTGAHGEDVEMADASSLLSSSPPPPSARSQDAKADSPERQLEELKRCVERFRGRIEGNAWARSVLASL